MIRKITRGTSSTNGDKTIPCTITNIDKVIVILNSDHKVITVMYGDMTSAGGGSVYLKSISNSNIVVCGHGTGTSSFRTNNGTRNEPSNNGSIDFSYQIIEFM